MPKHKGSAHSVVSPVPTQQRGSQPHTNQSSGHRPSPTMTSSSCPLCQGGHPLFYCPTFEGLPVSQRKEKVMGMKLCLNCLKPHHLAHDCHSTFRCRVQECGRKHNSLLHEDRAAGFTTQQDTPHQTHAATHADHEDRAAGFTTQQAPTHQTHAATHAEDRSPDEEDEECLLMTAKVTLLGPTGKIITVRALLDAGSTLSIIADKLMKNLNLTRTGKEVSISGIKSKDSQRPHPMAKVTLTSEYDPTWSRGDCCINEGGDTAATTAGCRGSQKDATPKESSLSR